MYVNIIKRIDFINYVILVFHDLHIKNQIKLDKIFLKWNKIFLRGINLEYRKIL
jgi:hypothetical protein